MPRAARAAAVISFALFCFYSAATPLFEASDELWHYPLVQHLANGGGLPVQRAGQNDADAPWRQEGSQPPFYYAVAALVSAPFDDANWRELRRLNPHADLGVQTSDGNVNAVLHAPAEDFPWRAAALAARMARLVSILFSTGTVVFTFFVARELFPGQPGDERALGAMLFVACVPMFAFISGSINNDNAAAFFCTLGLWRALRMARTQDLSKRSAVVAAVIAALGALSKTSALGALGLFALAAALAALGRWEEQSKRHRSDALRALLGWLLVFVFVTVLLAGWWFVRNVQLYGDALGWSAFLDAVGRRDTPATLAELWTEREGFVRTYWGVFGALNVGMPDWVYGVLDRLAAVAILGCVWGTLQAIRGHDGWRALTTPRARASAVCLAWLAVIFIALLRWTALTPASQGRLMFPAIAVIGAAMAYGLAAIHRWLLRLGVAVLAGVAITMPFVAIAPAYARPPNIWAQRLPVSVDAAFGAALRLVEAGGDAGAAPGTQATLRLNWELTQTLPVNISVFVHLIDENDVIVAQRDMHPGQGNLAVAEVAAPFRWSDRYALRIPRLARAPATLRWAVGVYDAATGQRLTLPNGADRIIFAGPALSADALAAAALSFANGADLMRVDGVQTAAEPGESFTLRTHWRLTSAALRDVNVSFQIIDAQGRKVAQSDGGLALTTWRTGEAAEATHTLRVEDSAAPGVYRLLLVMYVPEGDFAKISAYDDRGILRGVETTLTQFRVRLR
jgi:4-amino-4-deoxy-L-arabinose transferase-like glycosyltransferase